MKKDQKTAIVFISHAGSDNDLAMFVKTTLEEIIPGVEAFCSSDPADLPPGTKWPAEIQNKLNTAGILLLLATSRGLKRPWVWFECGSFWFRPKKLIPLCIGKVRKGSLPAPFSERMALNLDDSLDVNILIQTIEEQTSLKSKELDVVEFANSVNKKDREISEEVLKEDEGWIGVEWKENFLAYDGPYRSIKSIEDGTPEQSMKDALSKGGFKHRFSRADKITHYTEMGYHVVFLTDRKSWRQRLVSDKQIMMAKPEQ
jgi:hypothetical protein